MGKGLRRGKKKRSGRDHGGQLSVRHRGGGEKRCVRHREFREGTARVRKRERDGRRSGAVALRKKLGGTAKAAKAALPVDGKGQKNLRKPQRTGEYQYVLAARGRKQGIRVGEGNSRRGRSKPRKERSPGRRVSNVATKVNGEGKWRRAAGRSGQLRGKSDGKAQIRRKGGKRRLVPEECKAMVGVVASPRTKSSNSNLSTVVKYGSAGAKRRCGRRPTVRGEAMNPVDHPHGGRTRGGRPEKTPWGRRAK